MFKPFSLLKLWGSFNSVQNTYKEAKKKDRPWYMSREFRGAVILFIGAGLSVLFGIKVDENTLNLITENLGKIISAGGMLYGLIMGIVVLFKKKKK